LTYINANGRIVQVQEPIKTRSDHMLIELTESARKELDKHFAGKRAPTIRVFASPG
jgi:hypothetical protein